jgi:CheY-like chemotaxis protein
LASPELIKRLGRETKVQVLVAEARACDLSTSELAELLELLTAGPAEKAALSVAILDALAASGTPAGRIEDLRKAFGAPPGTGRTAAVRAPQTARNMPIIGSASQQTRPVQSPFRARFDAENAVSVPPPPPDPLAAVATDAAANLPPPPSPVTGPKPTSIVGAPVAPRAPLPLRGKAAEILKGGTTAGPAAPTPPASVGVPPSGATATTAPLPTVPVSEPRGGIDPSKARETFFGGSKGKPSKEAVLGPAAGRLTILVADDDKRIRMVFRLKLEEKGFNVQEAADGQEAWKRLEMGGISAAVLDMKMPGLHGLEILSRLADSDKNLPVVICTAYDRMDDEFVVATYPKLRYLTKPVDGEQLAEALIRLLAE